MAENPPLTAFLAAFFPDPQEQIRLRAFVPRGVSGHAEKLTVFREWFTRKKPQQKLKDWNKTRGIYFVVNFGGDLDVEITGGEEKGVTYPPGRFTACFAEVDDLPIVEQHEKLDAAPLKPSIRIETRKSVHAYWLLAGDNPGDACAEAWIDIQCRLIAYFGGDPSIKNPSRVMRLPYFDHVSADGSRKKIELVVFAPERRYTLAELQAAFPPAPEEVRQRKYAEEVGAKILEKHRNNTLASLAGSMRRRGMVAEEIEVALLAVNDRRCDPPLDADEVRAIAESISRYDPADEPSQYAAPPDEPPELDAAFTPSQATKTGGKEPEPLAVSWADFEAEQFLQGERIAFAAERGEIALLNALPNAGKTTLALIIALCLAIGRRFQPVVTESKPRRVLYIDGETRRARLQRDLRTMTKNFSREEAVDAGQNLHIICETEIRGEALMLTRTDHLLQLSVDALRVKPDFIVIDTLSSLCPVWNENDNAEQTRKVWRPLQKIARDCDAAILVLHHVGKRNEDSQTPERVYRGRGASASGGAARAVWLLIPDPNTPGLSTLSCVKAKGESPADVRLQLDQATRWMKTIEAAPPGPTPLEIVVAAVTQEMATSQIVAALKDQLKERAVKGYLTEAVELELLTKIKTGIYAPKCAQSAESAKDENAQPAQSAQPKKGKSAESARVIGDARDALFDKPHENNGLSQSAESALSIEACTPCTLEKDGQKAPHTRRVTV